MKNLALSGNFIPEYLKASSYENGKEVTDNIPKAMPLDCKRPLTMEQQIDRLLKKAKFQEAFNKLEPETKEEALDFNIEDNEKDEELSLYQHAFMAGVFDPKPVDSEAKPADKEELDMPLIDAKDDASGSNNSEGPSSST